jgi:hypothetical protein
VFAISVHPSYVTFYASLKESTLVFKSKGLHLRAIITSRFILDLLSSNIEKGSRDGIVLLFIIYIRPVEVMSLHSFKVIFYK